MTSGTFQGAVVLSGGGSAGLVSSNMSVSFSYKDNHQQLTPTTTYLKKTIQTSQVLNIIGVIEIGRRCGTAQEEQGNIIIVKLGSSFL